MIQEITPKELRARLDANEPLTVVDVREDYEVRFGKIAQAVHIPMNSIPEQVDEIPTDRPVVFVCKSGGRSEQVAMWVDAHGHENVYNMIGGMKQYAAEIDPSIPVNY